MPPSRHVPVDRTSSQTHEQPQQQFLRRSASAPALLLPLLLLADTPEHTFGWMHIPVNPADVQVSRTPSTIPASPVLSLGMPCHAVLRQRIKRSSSRLAGSTGEGLEGALLETPAGESALAWQARDAAGRRIHSKRARRRASTTTSGASSFRDRAKQQMKQLGRQGMWKEALEQLEREGSEGTHPVSPSSLRT